MSIAQLLKPKQPTPWPPTMPRYSSERHISTFEIVGYYRENGAEGRGRKVFTENTDGHNLSVIVDQHTGLVLRLFDWEWWKVPQRTDDAGNAIQDEQ